AILCSLIAHRRPLYSPSFPTRRSSDLLLVSLRIGVLGKRRMADKQHRRAEQGDEDTHSGETHGCSGFGGPWIASFTCRSIRSALRQASPQPSCDAIKAAAGPRAKVAEAEN